MCVQYVPGIPICRKSRKYNGNCESWSLPKCKPHCGCAFIYLWLWLIKTLLLVLHRINSKCIELSVTHTKYCRCDEEKVIGPLYDMYTKRTRQMPHCLPQPLIEKDRIWLSPDLGNATVVDRKDEYHRIGGWRTFLSAPHVPSKLTVICDDNTRFLEINCDVLCRVYNIQFCCLVLISRGRRLWFARQLIYIFRLPGVADSLKQSGHGL